MSLQVVANTVLGQMSVLECRNLKYQQAQSTATTLCFQEQDKLCLHILDVAKVCPREQLFPHHYSF